MVFKCQEDSFLREFSSDVISCVGAELNTVINGKKTTVSGYEVILKDTILFPEGGGQPCDHGYLDDKKVLQVTRRGEEAVHFVTEPIGAGVNVKQVVDWERRFDHMQQHSGQHLVSAILERDLSFPTVAWWLGDEVSYVELDTPAVTPEQIKKAEFICNDLIRAAKKVSVKVINDSTPEEELNDVRSKLPKDHKGDIRVIIIEDGVDSNLCCGTHVTNLSQLQAIKFLHTEKSSRKDKTLLYFLVGNRIFKRMDVCLLREQKLTALLNNNPVQHVDLVEKLQKSAKVAAKNLQTVLKDLAINEAQRLKNVLPPPKYYTLHRKEAEPDFMQTFVKEIGTTDIFLFLSVGDEKGMGNILLYGDETAIANLGGKVCELLVGKGAGKGNKFQAKVNKMVNRSKVEQLLKEYF